MIEMFEKELFMPKCSSGCIIEGMRTLKNFKLLKWMNQTGVRKVQPTSMQKAVQDAKFAIEATRPLSMQSPKFVEEAVEALKAAQARRIYK